MVTNRVSSVTGLLEPNAPDWAQRMVLRFTQFFKPTFPVEPARAWETTKAKLPPAADWEGGIVVVTDQNCLAVAVGGAWLKLTFGGPV